MLPSILAVVVATLALVGWHFAGITNPGKAAPARAPVPPVTQAVSTTPPGSWATSVPPVSSSMSRQTKAPSTTAIQPPVSGPSCIPTMITVKSVGFRESVVPEGMNKAGVIEPPPGQVIWYSGGNSDSPEPGAVGSAKIIGHDEYSGPSSFWNLDEVRPSQPIAVTCTSGKELTFVVTSAKSELKAPPQSNIDPKHPCNGQPANTQCDPTVWPGSVNYPQLIVVTCDKTSPVPPGTHHHLSNYIVYAKELP